MSVKKQVFAEVEAVVSPECVLATNTSSLSVTEMAAELEHPERVVGFHFFNPVAVMPLLEIVRAERTDDATLATAFAVGKALKKTCVLVKDAPGVHRQPAARPVPGRGRPGPSTRARPSRSPTGAFARSACRCRRSCCCSWSARPSRCTSPRRCTRRSPTGSTSPPNLRRLVAAGKPASTAGTSTAQPDLDEETKALHASRATAARPTEQVRDRARWPALAEEARLMLDEGVVAEAAGHRPGHDPRRRLAVPPRRHHARTWTGPASPSGSPAGASCPPASRASRPDQPEDQSPAQVAA